jgi:cytochrome c oxidase assembly protein subunit 19
MLIKTTWVIRNLMAPDNFENLGLIFKDGKESTPNTPAAGAASPEQKK